MRSHENRAGMTLLEMVVSLAVLATGMVALVASMGRATDFSSEMGGSLIADASAHRTMPALTEIFSETAIGFVDTTERFRTSSTSIDSDRFTYDDLTQCASPICRFHTPANLNVIGTHYDCGYEFRRGMGLTPLARGKVWPSGMTSCAFDGSPLLSYAGLDGVKALVSRGPDGSFQTNAGKPVWNGIALVFPDVGQDGLVSLKKYEVFMSDFLAAPPMVTAGWTRWTTPTFIDLLDFGGDGTNDGVPDGSIPVTAQDSDADEEFFLVGDNNGASQSVIIYKQLTNGGIYRRFVLIVRLSDGAIDLDVVHREGTEEWIARRTWTRAPKVLATDLTEFAVSTSASNPYDPVTNPTGVAQDGIVRITLGASRAVKVDGERKWKHQVDTFSIRPRN